MPQEIERRFLVLQFNRQILSSITPTHILQGYFELSSTAQQLRIRIKNGNRAFLGAKGGEGLVRDEEEEKISLKAARLLMRRAWHVVEKIRYERGGWELDMFKGPLEGLVLAEYEMTNKREKVQLPSWITQAVEVTDSLSNLHLARLCTSLRGLPDVSLSLVMHFAATRVSKIVLTGAPCSGKSVLMNILRQEFGESIHCVPEVATIVISQVGIRPVQGDSMSRERLNRAVLQTQEIFERTSLEQAIADNKRALVLDRGSLDTAAYMEGGLKEYRRRFGGKIGDGYDLVLCLETPPKAVYEKMRANNPARSETYEQAVALGERIQEVWSSHPRFRLIPNGNSWEHKAAFALDVIRKFIAQGTR